MRRKRRKRLTSVLRTVLPPPTGPNERWSMDFVSDALVGGPRLRAFVVVDRPGKPVENAYVESLSGKLRDEWLNENWFAGMEDARSRIEAWGPRLASTLLRQ